LNFLVLFACPAARRISRQKEHTAYVKQFLISLDFFPVRPSANGLIRLPA
jgi:hypothetical protein